MLGIGATVISLHYGIDTTYPYYLPFRQADSKNLDILTSCEWEEDTDGCPLYLILSDNGDIFNYCGCGEPGEIAFASSFIYDDDTKTIHLYNLLGFYTGTGHVLRLTEEELVVEFLDSVYTYRPVQNQY